MYFLVVINFIFYIDILYFYMKDLVLLIITLNKYLIKKMIQKNYIMSLKKF